MTHTELLTTIEAHCAARGMSVSTFGKLAVNDGKLVSRLRAGKTVTLDTVTSIQDFIVTGRTFEERVR